MVRAAASASPLKWCIEGLCCAELRGLELDRASLSKVPLLASGYLLLASDYLLASYYLLLASDYLRLATCDLLLSTDYLLLTVSPSAPPAARRRAWVASPSSPRGTRCSPYLLPTYLLPTTYYLLLTTCHLPLATCHLPLTTYHLLRHLGGPGARAARAGGAELRPLPREAGNCAGGRGGRGAARPRADAAPLPAP